MQEFRTFGPPGTGKTTYLQRQIERAAEKHGNDNIIVASFTRAAAQELVSRKVDVPADSIGTLHSLCYRAMNRPEIAELHIDDFNSKHPEYALSESVKVNVDDAMVEGLYRTEGDLMFSAYRRHRVQMTPPDDLPRWLIPFLKVWEGWKMRSDLIDFVDMIGMTLQAGSGPPGGQAIGIYDEAQDFNRLELTLVRKWAETQEYVILAGDDDQCLYHFTGATPKAFLYPPIPEDHKRILRQSFRVPRKVHKYASHWIKQLKEREPKEYNPRDFEGELRHIDANTHDPYSAIDDAERYISKGKTVMFLSSCGYMLNSLKGALKRNGIPFHNPYRKARGDWNPLGSSSATKTSLKDRFLAYLRKDRPDELWDIDDLGKWIDLVSARGNVRRGGKNRVDQEQEFRRIYTPDEYKNFYQEIFEPDFLQDAVRREPRWFVKRAIGAKSEKLEYPVKILETRGIEGLVRPPQVIISTIHGVKGGEADIVYLFPDLSLPAMKGWEEGGEDRDAIVRTFYVGMTRAKESLIICSPATRMHVQL